MADEPRSPAQTLPPTGQRHVAIALVSAAVLLFEVLVTRVLSVTLAYHFAFLSVSLAMLGLGAPGVWFSLRQPGPRALRRSLVAAAALLPLALVLITQLGASFRTIIVFWVACILLPLTALGSAICLLLLHATGKQVGKMYAADLVGAALGAVLAVPLLHGLPTPAVIAALGLLPLAAAALLFPPIRLGAVLAAAVLCAGIVGTPALRLRYTSHYVEDTPPVYEQWTPTARVTIFAKDPAKSFAGWGLGTRAPPVESENYWLDQDGSAGTEILRYRRGTPYPTSLLFDVTSVPYQIGTPRRACIIGGGGGRDILAALAGGAAQVDVVELNPYIVDAVSRVFGSYSGDPYHLPGVRVFVGEGRSHFTRVDQPCDVLQISLIDTFAASAAGAYALSENSLYTVEALRAFWTRLSPAGVLSITRWSRGPGQVEAARLVLLAVEVLRQEGAHDPRAYLAVVGARAVANVMLFRQPVDRPRLAELGAVATRRGFQMLWPLPPNLPPPSLVTIALREGGAPFYRLGLDVSPPTDDRPFFFQTLDFLHGSEAVARAGSGVREQSVTLLRQLLLVLAIVTLALFFLPLAFRKLPRIVGLGRGTTYFAAIGVGFMLVEVPLVQRLTIYLGHPSYATTVVLGALLLGAGVGATLASAVPEARARAVALATPFALAAFVLPLVGPLATATSQWAFVPRVVLAATLVFGAGVAMGLPFPLGMTTFDGAKRSWYWAINGAAGVLASVLALVLSMIMGFFSVVCVAFVCYCVAALSFPGGPGRASPLPK